MQNDGLNGCYYGFRAIISHIFGGVQVGLAVSKLDFLKKTGGRLRGVGSCLLEILFGLCLTPPPTSL